MQYGIEIYNPNKAAWELTQNTVTFGGGRSIAQANGFLKRANKEKFFRIVERENSQCPWVLSDKNPIPLEAQ